MGNGKRISHERVPDRILQELSARDVALWVGPKFQNVDPILLSRLVGLPWRLVLSERSDTSFLQAIESSNESSSPLHRKRGFAHIIGRDPQGVQTPPRALPLFLLNGRDDPREPEESSKLSGIAAMRRRLNMLHELVASRPKSLVILSSGDDQPITDAITLWNEENFRVLITVISIERLDAERVDQWLASPGGPAAVDYCSGPSADLVHDFVSRFEAELTEGRLIVSMRTKNDTIKHVDITAAELIERPLLAGYDLIETRHLKLIQPHELSLDGLQAFFDRTDSAWEPYAAGLPWRRSPAARKTLFDTLDVVATEGPSANCALSIVADRGAGGTTFARWLAFEAASAGYPTLVAKNGNSPQVGELAGFLYRAHLEALSQTATTPLTRDSTAEREEHETPWLIVYDVGHWEGRSLELSGFIKGLIASGRPAVMLVVNTASVPLDLTKQSRTRHIVRLTHELSLEQALELGRHLNRFLKPLNKERSPAEWQTFWERHHPQDITVNIAHFWIALEFWLKGHLDLNQSIQSWLYDSFRDASIPDDVRRTLLEVAALTIELQPLPEALLPLPAAHKYPYSVLLEDVRVAVPALALVRGAVGEQKMWAMAHDLLGRYLLTAVFYDFDMRQRLGLGEATDPIEFRLAILRRVACREALALAPFRKLALCFAIKILKLDISQGNQEFNPYWREVLAILEAMPVSLKDTSRTFNHHVAVSMRRVAKQEEFGIDNDERRRLLEHAVERLNYALYDLTNKEYDYESDLNLLNSLALAYQDLADIEKAAGAEQAVIDKLRTKATEATRKALEQDPSSHFVLETTAKNLIQNGETYQENCASNAAEALGYIYQALSLERSEHRQFELAKLANRAIRLLRAGNDHRQVMQLVRTGNPLGTLAQAWLVLTEGVNDLEGYDLMFLPAPNVIQALEVLEQSKSRSQWMILRFRYDLTSVAHPYDFPAQLRLLDELEGTNYKMPLQLLLEHSILLHQERRHMEGNRKFKFVRQRLKQSEAVTEVPERLHWLRVRPDGPRRICEAQVIEVLDRRSIAKLHDFKDEIVPFIPQEFGVQTVAPGTRFKCFVNFGRKGPFLKPPKGDGGITETR